eukprot:728596-Amphidinium_carterae.1
MLVFCLYPQRRPVGFDALYPDWRQKLQWDHLAWRDKATGGTVGCPIVTTFCTFGAMLELRACKGYSSG